MKRAMSKLIFIFVFVGALVESCHTQSPAPSQTPLFTVSRAGLAIRRRNPAGGRCRW